MTIWKISFIGLQTGGNTIKHNKNLALVFTETDFLMPYMYLVVYVGI